MNNDINENKVASFSEKDKCIISLSSIFGDLVFILALGWLIITFNPAIGFGTLLLERKGICFK